jgi:hypothetical protein
MLEKCYIATYISTNRYIGYSMYINHWISMCSIYYFSAKNDKKYCWNFILKPPMYIHTKFTKYPILLIDKMELDFNPMGSFMK